MKPNVNCDASRAPQRCGFKVQKPKGPATSPAHAPQSLADLQPAEIAPALTMYRFPIGARGAKSGASYKSGDGSRKRDIRDPELRKQFRAEIKVSLAEVSKQVDDARDCFVQYVLLALNYLDGKPDPFGLSSGPGRFLSMRYDNHIRQLRTGGMAGLRTTDAECMLISAFGDSVCWTFVLGPRWIRCLEQALGGRHVRHAAGRQRRGASR